jgi:threonine/homoserine/homoserine lactone efflux protein
MSRKLTYLMPSLDVIAALAGVAFASTWTPGPNNIMLANSGATFGYRATLAHAFGVALGFPVMMFVLALGLGELFQRSAALREGLRWLGVAVMLWLSWRIATAGRARADGRARPFTFAEAAAFQWVNPKAWVLAVGVPAAFLAGVKPLAEAAICAAVFTASGLSSAHGWALFGAALRRALSSAARLRAFNVTMGLLLTASAAYLAASDL